MDNAAASIEGSGKVLVETLHDKELNIVRMEISDTGVGISAEDKARLFEPYFFRKTEKVFASHRKQQKKKPKSYIRVKDNIPRGPVS